MLQNNSSCEETLGPAAAAAEVGHDEKQKHPGRALPGKQDEGGSVVALMEHRQVVL